MDSSHSENHSLSCHGNVIIFQYSSNRVAVYFRTMESIWVNPLKPVLFSTKDSSILQHTLTIMSSICRDNIVVTLQPSSVVQTRWWKGLCCVRLYRAFELPTNLHSFESVGGFNLNSPSLFFHKPAVAFQIA